MGYGKRYLKVEEFVSYCKKLKIETSKDELEYYEKHGLMLPLARTIFPEEYVQLVSHKFMQSVDRNLLKKWSEIESLDNRRFIFPEDFNTCTDKDFIEAFDNEFDKNPHLFKPTVETFNPWDSYIITVKNEYGQDVQDSIADHYYAYWQVHQLYRIRSITRLHQFRQILEYVNNEKFKSHLTFPLRNPTPFREFIGRSRYFDALSFFRRMYYFERARTFAPIPEKNGIKTLNEVQFKEYRKRLHTHALFVVNRYSLDDVKLFWFLNELMKLQSDYESAEKARLAYEIKKDVLHHAEFLMILTGKTWEMIGDEIGKQTDNFVKRDFLHLDITTKIYDTARDVFLDSIRKLNNESENLTTVSQQFNDTLVNEILEFCEKNDLEILPATLDEMIILIPADEVPPEIELRKYRKTTRYTNLKNFATSFEYLLKVITKDREPSVKATTMTPIIQEIMCKEYWFPQFNRMIEEKYHLYNNAEEFFINLNSIKLPTTIDEFWARNFLIAVAARNFSTHTFSTDDRIYGDYMTLMIDSIIYSIIYLWSKAKNEKWIQVFAPPSVPAG